ESDRPGYQRDRGGAAGRGGCAGGGGAGRRAAGVDAWPVGPGEPWGSRDAGGLVIPNVVKSAAPIRTVRYLVGPGRHEEHRDPHLVAGSDLPMQVYGSAVLDADAAKELALWLDAPRRLHGVEMTVPRTAVDPETGNKIVVGTKEEYFWHCSL